MVQEASRECPGMKQERNTEVAKRCSASKGRGRFAVSKQQLAIDGGEKEMQGSIRMDAVMLASFAVGQDPDGKARTQQRTKERKYPMEALPFGMLLQSSNMPRLSKCFMGCDGLYCMQRLR